jgi:hypothetical protein
MFFANTLEEEKEARAANHTQTFLWEPFSENQGTNKQILTHVFSHGYGFPKDFVSDWSSQWLDVPIQPDKTTGGYNVDWKVHSFINHAHEVADGSKANQNIIIPFGEDFAYMNSVQVWAEIDKIIKYVNEMNQVNMTVI